MSPRGRGSEGRDVTAVRERRRHGGAMKETGEGPMKLLVVPKLRAGASAAELQPHAQAEIQAVWDLYTQGICREFYARADQSGGAVLMVESPTIEAARDALATLPMVRLALLEMDVIPLAPFTHLTRLFQAAG